jgi:hypothetical protein
VRRVSQKLRVRARPRSAFGRWQQASSRFRRVHCESRLRAHVVCGTLGRHNAQRAEWHGPITERSEAERRELDREFAKGFWYGAGPTVVGFALLAAAVARLRSPLVPSNTTRKTAVKIREALWGRVPRPMSLRCVRVSPSANFDAPTRRKLAGARGLCPCAPAVLPKAVLGFRLRAAGEDGAGLAHSPFVAASRREPIRTSGGPDEM